MARHRDHRGADKRPVVVLASSSPQRADLLRRLGVDPLIVSTDVDETVEPGESAPALVERLALAKLLSGCGHYQASDNEPAGSGPPESSTALVIAADTVVDIDDVILGKPEGRAEAERMLTMLSGETHRVFSGVAVAVVQARKKPQPVSGVAETEVVMRPGDADLISWYVETGEPLDKAGAYGIQGKGSLLVEEVRGSYPNVVGLPITLVDQLCSRFGWPLHQLSRPVTTKAGAGSMSEPRS